jgi:uncharacterized Ntn-hydrolase superfamily protein
MLQLNTFSIVAHDPEENAWGVAVASKFLAAGALVSWAQAGVGAVATQSYAKVGFGPEGLRMMSEGKSASETLKALLEADAGRETRQVGIVDAQGGAAAHTGAKCNDWAGHKVGEGFTCQGNILAGAETVEAMHDAYIATKGELADRLVAALRAGESAGGDKRGKQSAAVLVVRPNGGYGGDNDRYIDLRVDDDEAPVKKLQDLLASHHLFFGTAHAEDQLAIDENIARELQQMMLGQGYMGGEVNGIWDEVSQQAFMVLVGNENLEERWHIDKQPTQIDRVALDYLRRRFR